MFIHLLKRLYLIPFRKISRAKGNNRTDRHLLDSFSRLLLTPKVGVPNFRLVILQRQWRTKNCFKRLRWSFSGKIEDGFLVVNNSYGHNTLP